MENTLRHNYAIREEERVRMDEMNEEERVRMAHNYIIIFSDNKSDSGRRKIPPKPVTSSNKASIFSAKRKLMILNMRRYIRMH